MLSLVLEAQEIKRKQTCSCVFIQENYIKARSLVFLHYSQNLVTKWNNQCSFFLIAGYNNYNQLFKKYSQMRTKQLGRSLKLTLMKKG